MKKYKSMKLKIKIIQLQLWVHFTLHLFRAFNMYFVRTENSCNS